MNLQNLIPLALLLFYCLYSIGQDSSPLKGKLLYANSLASEADVAEWTLEGPAQVTFEEDWMHLLSPNEEGHHVFWCPTDFPGSFVAEWELQNMETDAGLCIIFFAANGVNGEDIFDPGLRKRTGIFRQYTKSDLNTYHISYYANTPIKPGRDYAHLRKNKGFHKVHIGEQGIEPGSTAIHRMRLVKDQARITMYVDDRKIIGWTDDGTVYGPVLEGGKIGLRQMQWSHFRYRNLKVWELAGHEQPDFVSWNTHTIDASSTGADGVKLGDINGDGKPDITTGWEEGGLTKLYLHPGADKVQAEWPAVLVGKTPKVEDAVFADLNSDGKLDIVSCTEKNSEKIFVHWAPKSDWLKAKKWKQEVLPASVDRMMWMFAEPLQVDQRNGIDLIAAGKGENAELGWFEAPATGSKLAKWKWHSITPVGWIMSILLEDMDADGDMDILITDRRGPLSGCRWLENPGELDAQRLPWKNHFVGMKGLEVMFMSFADLDDDGVKEAIVGERTGQRIWIFSRKENASLEWKEHRIDLPKSTATVKSVEAGDITGDGIPDLVISTNTNGAEMVGLTWLDGKQLANISSYDFHPVSGVHTAKYDKVELIDIDEDGDLDVLICEENHGPNSEGLGVIWYENRLGESH